MKNNQKKIYFSLKSNLLMNLSHIFLFLDFKQSLKTILKALLNESLDLKIVNSFDELSTFRFFIKIIY